MYDVLRDVEIGRIMPTSESWTAPARDRLKEAIKLKQEARRWKQNAVFAEAAGYANRGLECRANGTYPEVAAGQSQSPSIRE
ncbi:MAG: hypothetical protein ACRD8U_00025 [Pyrinomonadaceae bacterium]